MNENALEQRLSEKGITCKALLDTAITTYIYDPAIGPPRIVREKVRKGFRAAFADINVAALVTAGILLEEAGEKGMIPNVSRKKYAADPVDLIADEILGQAIAQYLAGTRALFEFERLDKNKPGILAALPPILDDIVAGLIAGVMVKVCSQ